MNTRKLAIALTSAGIATAAFGSAVLPADAKLRTFRVVLVTGQTLTVTVDAPPEIPASQVTIPGVSVGIVSITEVTPPEGATPGAGVGGGGAPEVQTPTTPAPAETTPQTTPQTT